MMQSAPQKLITLIGLVTTTDLNVFPMLFRPILKCYVVMQTVHKTAMKIVPLLTENGRPLAVYGCRPIKSV